MDEGLNTRYFQVDPLKPDGGTLVQCGQIIRQGGLVAFPTETVYGLGANALDGEACKAIFMAKGRPQDNPLIVHVSSFEEVVDLVSAVPETAITCMERFWPGPLTLVMPKSAKIPAQVSAGLETVALRMPDHPVALALIRAAGVPIAAPSANLSGRPSPTLAQHVMEDLAGKVDAVLDAGACRVGLESTVLDLSEEIPTILRPGGVTREELTDILGKVRFDPGLSNPDVTPRSPGVKYLHYAPRGEAVMVEGTPENVRRRIALEVRNAKAKGLRVGVLCTGESVEFLRAAGADYLAELGSRLQPQSAAATLYEALRECDSRGIQLILAETFDKTGIGTAVMNRLEKAAGYRRIVEK